MKNNMEKKVVSIAIKEAKNVIGIFPNNIVKANTSEHPEEVELFFCVPECLVFAAFNDNSLSVVPISDLESISDLEIDLANENYAIRYGASLNMVKAFVGTILKYENTKTEKEAKEEVRRDLCKAGVSIDKETLDYLKS